MTNPKLDKIQSDIAKTKARINEAQARLRALEKYKIELENESFINIIRSERISDLELSAIMQSLRKEQPKPAAQPVLALDKTKLEETSDADDET